MIREVPIGVGVGHTDRENALALLRRHCVDGSMTLEEFSDLAGAVLSAREVGELASIVDSLPVLPVAPVHVAPRVGARWIGGFFGTTKQRAQWQLPPRTNVVAVFGSAKVDLADAGVVGDSVDFVLVTFFGTVKLVVPRGIDMDVTGVPVFGTRKDRVRGRAVLPGSPVVRVRCYPVFGTVKILDR